MEDNVKVDKKSVHFLGSDGRFFATGTSTLVSGLFRICGLTCKHMLCMYTLVGILSE